MSCPVSRSNLSKVLIINGNFGDLQFGDMLRNCLFVHRNNCIVVPLRVWLLLPKVIFISWLVYGQSSCSVVVSMERSKSSLRACSGSLCVSQLAPQLVEFRIIRPNGFDVVGVFWDQLAVRVWQSRRLKVRSEIRHELSWRSLPRWSLPRWSLARWSIPLLSFPRRNFSHWNVGCDLNHSWWSSLLAERVQFEGVGKWANG